MFLAVQEHRDISCSRVRASCTFPCPAGASGRIWQSPCPCSTLCRAKRLDPLPPSGWRFPPASTSWHLARFLAPHPSKGTDLFRCLDPSSFVPVPTHRFGVVSRPRSAATPPPTRCFVHLSRPNFGSCSSLARNREPFFFACGGCPRTSTVSGSPLDRDLFTGMAKKCARSTVMDEESDRRTAELHRLGARHPIPITVEDVRCSGLESSAGTRDSPEGVAPAGPIFVGDVSSSANVRDGQSKRKLSFQRDDRGRMLQRTGRRGGRTRVSCTIFVRGRVEFPYIIL